jgi:osmotically-inducible protein OsmY
MGRDEQNAKAQLDDEALEVRWSQYFMSLGMEKSAPSPQTGGRKEVALRGIVQWRHALVS